MFMYICVYKHLRYVQNWGATGARLPSVEL